MIAAILAVVALAVIAGGVVTTVALSRQAERGWNHAIRVEHETRSLMVARVTTLENRLLAQNANEYAGLQHVPDETAKAAWAERQHHFNGNGDGVRLPESFGLTEEERRAADRTYRGDDLEPEDMVFEGPTLG